MPFVCSEWPSVLLLPVFTGNIFPNNRTSEPKNNAWLGFNVIIVNVSLTWVIGSQRRSRTNETSPIQLVIINKCK